MCNAARGSVQFLPGQFLTRTVSRVTTRSLPAHTRHTEHGDDDSTNALAPRAVTMSRTASPAIRRHAEEREQEQEEEVRIKEETKYSFVEDIRSEATRVARGLILKEQDYNSPAVHRSKTTPGGSRRSARNTPRQFSARPSPRLSSSTRKPSPRITPRSRKPTPNSKKKTQKKSTVKQPPAAAGANRLAALKAEAGVKQKSPLGPSPRKRGHGVATATDSKVSGAGAAAAAAKLAATTPAPGSSPKKSIKIHEKSTVAYQARLQSFKQAAEEKKTTPLPLHSRFSNLGSLYWKPASNSPLVTEFMDPQSSLNTRGGYMSTTERPKPKVATEIASLECIGLAHSGVKKPASAKKAKKQQSTPGGAAKSTPADTAAAAAQKAKEEARARRRRTVSVQLAEGISSRLSSTNARIVNESKVITNARQLIDYQMNRALQYLGYHLNTEAGQKVLRNIAVENSSNDPAGVSQEEIEAAQNELTTMLANAVRDHCSKWWDANMVDRTVVQIKPKATPVPRAAAAGVAAASK